MLQVEGMSRREKMLWIFLGVLTLAVSIQRTGKKIDLNNFLIFRHSFGHLLAGQDLYALYPAEYFDLYKYGPAFASLMAPFALLPVWLGATLWNLGGLFLMGLGLWELNVTSRQRQIIMWICLPELIGNFQNFQSNAYIVGFFMLTFSLLERRHFFWAGLMLALSVHVKVFGITLLAFGVFYPGAWKFWSYSFLWLVALAALPLVFVSPEALAAQYHSWLHLLVWDSNGSRGTSFMGAFYGLTGVALPNLAVQLVAGILLVLPMIFKRGADHEFRLLAFASTLMWIIVFNHKSESPTFIIGMLGIALWYVLQTWRGSGWVLAFTLLFVSVFYSDVTTPEFKQAVLARYELKVWPLIAVWTGLQYALCRRAWADYRPAKI